MLDKQRSAFGLGWEYRRRKKDIGENPFASGTNKYAWFRQGFLSFQERSRTNQYEEEKECDGI